MKFYLHSNHHASRFALIPITSHPPRILNTPGSEMTLPSLPTIRVRNHNTRTVRRGPEGHNCEWGNRLYQFFCKTGWSTVVNIAIVYLTTMEVLIASGYEDGLCLSRD